MQQGRGVKGRTRLGGEGGSTTGMRSEGKGDKRTTRRPPPRHTPGKWKVLAAQKAGCSGYLGAEVGAEAMNPPRSWC